MSKKNSVTKSTTKKTTNPSGIMTNGQVPKMVNPPPPPIKKK